METDNKGIPLKGPYPEGVPIAVFFSVFHAVFGLVGYAIAQYVIYGGEVSKAKADAKIAILAEYDLGWIYMGLIAVKLLQIPLMIAFGDARKKSKTHAPDQHVYEVKGAEGSKLGYVLMVTDGVQGEFNRAQRAWSNYHETMALVVILFLASGWVFPFESFLCAVIWGLARVMYAFGYGTSAEGREIGFMISTFVPNVMQGMMIIAAMKSI